MAVNTNPERLNDTRALQRLGIPAPKGVMPAMGGPPNESPSADAAVSVLAPRRTAGRTGADRMDSEGRGTLAQAMGYLRKGCG